MRQSKRTSGGYTLLELCVTLTIICVTAAILFPIFAPRNGHGSRHSICASNLKQTGLAVLGYVQDNDEKYPLAAYPIKGEEGFLSGWTMTHDAMGDAAVSRYAEGKTTAEKLFVTGPLSIYVKNDQIFRCPNMPRKAGPLSYMVNDLATGASQADFPAVATSVLMCEGEDFAGNVGHAYEPTLPALTATFSPTGAVVLGATMQTAPTRHVGGANYGFADGHVKWFKPPDVFFPSRFSSSGSHKNKSGRLLGPAPGGGMRFDGRHYKATFHLW